MTTISLKRSSESFMTEYRVEKVTLQMLLDDDELWAFYLEHGEKVAKLHGDTFDWAKFDVFRFARDHRMMVCRRRGKPVGVMLSMLLVSEFDPEVTILRQKLLYALPGTRAAKLLMDDFIDFGRSRANHIITTVSEHTNIKPQSLEKRGFKKLEVLYRLEV
jgi:hypothetical protein